MTNINEIFITSNIIKVETGFQVSWFIAEDLPYFRGHFPNNPVLPAIALLDFVQFIFSIYNPNQQSEFKDIKSAKFCAVIKPNDNITANFTFNSKTNYWTVTFENQSDLLVSQIRFQFS